MGLQSILIVSVKIISIFSVFVCQIMEQVYTTNIEEILWHSEKY